MTVVIDTLARDAAGSGGPSRQPLYKRREPIYPKLVRGPYRTLKWALLIVTLGIYYATPWIRWPRPAPAPDQAVLVDFVHGRFYFFWIHLWPDEVYFFTGLLVLAALSLFFVTSLFGRLWCGYACPQTVWTDLFIAVERFFEGDRNARLRLNEGPLSAGKIVRKLGKHLVWILVAMATGGAWILYFHDAPMLARQFFVGAAPASAYVFCAILTFTTYALAGTMREQVCIYMCPWPRIQGAMLDKHSLQVTYRYDRGEPRGAHKKDASWEGRGDCVDCQQCVVVCPMGVDIRKGMQFECINCGLCIDACDEIMARVGRPPRLIAYDTDARVASRAKGETTRLRLLRPRTLFYAFTLALASGLITYGLATRPVVSLHVVRDRSPYFVRLHDGAIRNGYTLEVANRSFDPQSLLIDVQGLKNAIVRQPGETAALTAAAAADQTTSVRLFITVPAASLAERLTPTRIVLRDRRAGAVLATANTTFVWDGGGQ